MSLDKRLKLTPKQLRAFKKLKNAFDEFNKSGAYLLPWDEFAYPINMEFVDDVCTDEFRNGDKSKYISFTNFGSGDLSIEHESCFINTSVFIKFKEVRNG